MGVSIHWKLCQEKRYVKATLDRAHARAKEIKVAADEMGIPMKIREKSESLLSVDIGGCETLLLGFKTVREIKAEHEKKGYTYEWNSLADIGADKIEVDEGYMIDKYPQNELAYATRFCKTQYAENIIEHQWVCDILRAAAMFCKSAEVNDEGDYYHSGDLADAIKAIGESGKMIAQITTALKKNFGEDHVITGGETKIGKRRKK